MFRLEYIKENYRSFSLYWDFFVLFFSIANLILILFDLTYLSLRTFYYQNIRSIVSWYDPYLGIESHPITKRYNYLVIKIKESSTNEEALFFQKKMNSLSQEIIEKNPFEISGMNRYLQEMKQVIQQKFQKDTHLKYNVYNLFKTVYPYKNLMEINVINADVLLFQWLWLGQTKKEIQRNVAFYHEKLKFFFNINYIRHYSIDGNFVDNFYKLDFPFYFFFLCEFLIHWFISIKRKEYSIGFLFPLYRWYDVLSLIPIYQFRIFRLFRIISIYTRIKKNNLTYIGNDMISNTLAKYANIVIEELSDMVSIKILDEIQEEIKQGNTKDLYLGSALTKNRQELQNIILQICHKSLENQSVRNYLRDALEKSLIQSASRVNSLKMVPNFLKENLTKEIGLSIFDSINETLLNLSQKKDKDFSILIHSIFGEVIKNLQNEKLNLLFKKILLQILEEVKKNVSRKKWKKNFIKDEND